MILEAHNLRFAYHGPDVLRDVNIRIVPGVTVIIGPNAAGKSTLLKCLCGMLTPHGTVRLDGRPLPRVGHRRRTDLISYLPQQFTSRASLTVFEAVLLGRLHTLSWRIRWEDLRIVEGVLAEMDMADLSDRPITELSGGQLQMTVFAQAIARQPKVLLMDEPTSNLDLRHQFRICQRVRSLTDSRGMSTVMALHDLNVAARFADTIVVLHEGAIRDCGRPSDVLTEEMIASVYGVAAKVTSDEQNRPMVTALGPID